MSNIFGMNLHSEGMKTEYSGTVEINGEEFEIQPKISYGYAGKLWGRTFPNP